jgi:hypothetical protein
LRERLVSARLLAIVLEGQEPAARAGMPALAAIARAEDAAVRLAVLRRLPPPQVDRHDRVVAGLDAEMARVERAVAETLGAAARAYDGVALEVIVRFGAPGREALIETQAWAPDVAVLFDARRGDLVTRLRLWALRRHLARRHARVLVLETPRRPLDGELPHNHELVLRPATRR